MKMRRACWGWRETAWRAGCSLCAGLWPCLAFPCADPAFATSCLPHHCRLFPASRAGGAVPPPERAVPPHLRGEPPAVQHGAGPAGQHPGLLSRAAPRRHRRRHRLHGGGGQLAAALFLFRARLAAPTCMEQPALPNGHRWPASRPLDSGGPRAPPSLCPQLGEEGALNVFSQKHNKWHTFKFDKAFGEDSSQDDVYQETQPLIRSVLDGGWRRGRAGVAASAVARRKLARPGDRRVAPATPLLTSMLPPTACCCRLQRVHLCM